MKLRNNAVVAILVLLVGCGSAEDATIPAESAVSQNEFFDSAVQNIGAWHRSTDDGSLGCGQRIPQRGIRSGARGVEVC
jgi:hypothetical protein